MQRHIDPREAEEVVRLAAARETAPSADGPTVEGLAEALGLPVSEVERLLAQVRGRSVPTPSRRRFADRSAALSAAIVLAIIATVAGIRVAGAYIRHPADVPAVGSDPLVVGDDAHRIVITQNGVQIHEGSEMTPLIEPPAAPTITTAPASPFFSEDELTGDASAVRQATRSVAKLSPAQRKAQYESLMETIQSHRSVGAEIRRKAPARRTSGEKSLLQAIEAFDRLFDTSGEG